MVKNYSKKAVIFFLVMFAFLAVSISVAPPVSAQVIPDNVCLLVTITENEAGPLPTPFQKVKMNVHLASDNAKHFTIWGKVIVSGDAPFYVGGTGILESTTLTMNLTSSQRHTDGWRDTGVMQVKYNISTLKGTFYEIGHDFDTVNHVFDERFTAGSLRQCP